MNDQDFRRGLEFIVPRHHLKRIPALVELIKPADRDLFLRRIVKGHSVSFLRFEYAKRYFKEALRIEFEKLLRFLRLI